MKTGVIIQARTGSTRFPDKVLKALPFNDNVTVLQQCIRRLRFSTHIDDIIVATTSEKDDDKIKKICDTENVKCFRGSTDNVLSRYYYAAEKNNLDLIIRITSDCPCIDPEIIDNAIELHVSKQADYTSNTLQRTFPHGLDTEVFNFNVLKDAFENAKNIYETEHVTTYIWKSNPEKFRIEKLLSSQPVHRPDIRITLDTEPDYALLCIIYDELYGNFGVFKEADIIDLFERKPWLSLINKTVMHKKVCRSFEEEATEALRILKLQNLNNVYDRLKELV